MNLYTVTYTRELTQTVKAHTLDDAGAYARKYAANNRMRALSVYPAEPPPPVASLPAA